MGVKVTEEVKDKVETTEEVKDKVDHTNPFNKGVTYESFLKAIGKKKPAEVLKNVCTKEQIDWVERELESFSNNKKK